MSDYERYMEIDGKRWRRSDPAIPESLADELVKELMSARRAVKAAGKDSNGEALCRARARVHDAKLALGERGTPWWETPDKAAQKERLAAAMRALLRQRDEDKTICPSDAARIAGGQSWRECMELTRSVARDLADDQWLEIVQKGQAIEEPAKGPIRLRRRAHE